jgi:hypothetical protein
MNNERITRRDFLKLSGLASAAIFIPKGMERLGDNLESWPGLKIEDLPSFYKDVLLNTPKTDFSPAGILRMGVVENGFNSMREVPVCQTKFNQRFLEFAKHSPTWRFVTDQPIGLGLHWFGDRPEFAATWYPQGTAREYIEAGLCGDRSVQFVVGDGVPKPGQSALDDKLAIVQAEKPDENGNWIASAHIIEVDRKLFENGTQYFANASYSLFRDYGFSDPEHTSILQQLYQPGYNMRPNIQLVGIEIQGCFFDDPEYFPSIQKFSNTLAVCLAVIKRHKISSPAFNLMGHEELDEGKGDPGKNTILGMKMFIGLSALVSGDAELKELVFSPFSLDGKLSKETAIGNYFSYIKDYFGRTAGPTSFVDYWNTFFQTDTIQNLVTRNLVRDAEGDLNPNTEPLIHSRSSSNHSPEKQ